MNPPGSPAQQHRWAGLALPRRGRADSAAATGLPGPAGLRRAPPLAHVSALPHTMSTKLEARRSARPEQVEDLDHFGSVINMKGDQAPAGAEGGSPVGGVIARWH